MMVDTLEMQISLPMYLHVGSSTKLHGCASSNIDIDVIAVLDKITSQTVQQAIDSVLELCVRAKLCNTNVSIELRHGPFKREDGTIQVHLLLHTFETLYQISLATRICWVKTAGWFTGNLKVEDLLNCTSFSDEGLRISCKQELRKVISMIQTETIHFREWLTNSPPSYDYVLVDQSLPVCSDFELRSLLRHALSSTQFNLSIWPNSNGPAGYAEHNCLITQAGGMLADINDVTLNQVSNFLWAVDNYYQLTEGWMKPDSFCEQSS